MFPNKDWKRDALKVLIDTTCTVDRHPDSGRPCTVCTTANNNNNNKMLIS